MNRLMYLLEGVATSGILIYLIICTVKVKQLSSEIDTLRFEQDKLNFRLYLAEKVNKIAQDKNVS